MPVPVTIKRHRSLVPKIDLAKLVDFDPQMALGEEMDPHIHPTFAQPRPIQLVRDTRGPNLKLRANYLTRKCRKIVCYHIPVIILATFTQRQCRANWWPVSRRQRWRSETLSRKGRVTWSWSTIKYRGSRIVKRLSTMQIAISGVKIRTLTHNLRVKPRHSSLNRGLIKYPWCHQIWSKAKKCFTTCKGLKVALIKPKSRNKRLGTWSLQTLWLNQGLQCPLEVIVILECSSHRKVFQNIHRQEENQHHLKR